MTASIESLASDSLASRAARFRFAPTPSRELHVGNALAALVDWAMARAARGAFVLRIEDIDRARCKPAFEEAIYRDLAWLGLDWDEGPDVGGPFAPYRQSERIDLYDAHLDALGAAHLAYACVCSRADIRAAQSAPHVGDGDELAYPGTCRDRGLLLPADVSGTLGRGGIRLDLAALAARGIAPVVTWRDGMTGVHTEDVRATAGDVLLGRPGQPTYQLAVVADDRAMAVSDVVRGVDLQGSTARQILLHRALGAEVVPRFHHHPLLLDRDHKKLSKRDAALSIRSHAPSDPSFLRASLGRAIGLFGARIAQASSADWVDAIAAIAAAASDEATATAAPPALHDAIWPA